MNIDTDVLKDLTKMLTRGERVKPITDEENACYKLISDPDHVVGAMSKVLSCLTIYEKCSMIVDTLCRCTVMVYHFFSCR